MNRSVKKGGDASMAQGSDPIRVGRGNGKQGK